MSWRLKFLNLFRQQATKSQVNYDGYLPWGVHDDFPLRWAKIISESPSGSSCVSTIGDFLEGFGFSDPDLEKRVMNNKGETMWTIHHDTVESFKQYEGFAWLFKFNSLAQITSWEVLEFENCRLGKPDDKGYISEIKYNPFFGTRDFKSSDKKQTICYDVFNPKGVKDQIAKQGEKFKGQVLWFGTTMPLSRFYPLPEAFSCADWMETEASVGVYHKKKVKKGFLKDFILGMIGNPHDPSTNPDYTNETNNGHPVTVAEEFDNVVGENFMGADNADSVWVQWFNSKEEIPVPIELPTNVNSDTFITLDNQATKKITVGWKVPAILANINEGVSLGGDGNTIRVAVKLMQQRVMKRQRLLTENYEKILKLLDQPYVQQVTIAPYNPYPELEIIDQKIWDAMTEEERRDWIEKNTEIELIDDSVTAPTQARVTNKIPIGFPDKIKANAKRAKDYRDKMEIKCGGRAGWEVSDSIINNENMGHRQLKRIHSYLKKNEKYANEPFNSGCDAILYHAWGGKEMFDYLDSKLKDVDAWLN